MKNISALIPEYVFDLLKDKDIDSLEFPIVEQLKAGILFTDICSFSNITEQVSQSGRYGVEVITDILSIYFTGMIKDIKSNHGHLMKYGGDSIVAIFPGNCDTSISRMLNCKKNMLESLKSLNKEFASKYNIEISFHGAASWGDISMIITGDLDYHLDYYLTGEAIEEAFIIGDNVGKNEIYFPKKFEKILPVKTKKEVIISDFSQTAKKFVPAKVLQKLEFMSFNAELRNSAVIFLHLNHEQTKIIDPVDFHSFYKKVQKTVYEMDGSINKIDYNEKGYIILITFGVPNIHDNDAERAFVCSNRIMNIPRHKINVQIGITYENIYAGIIGASQRYEYGIIGNSVNTAARLMVFAKDGEITFSSVIKDKISSYFETTFIKETSVKGIKEKIKVYKLLRKLPESWIAFKNKYNKKIIPPRDKQKDDIFNHIKTNKSNIFTIVGKSGVGKTFLMFNVLNDFFNLRKNIEFINLREYNKKINLYFIKNILKKKLNIDNIKNNLFEIKNFCIKEHLNIDFKLLSDFLKNKFDQFSPESSEKINIANELLSSIAFSLLKDTHIIAIDNLHWLDSSSQKLLEMLIPKLIKNNTYLLFTSDYGNTFRFIEKYDNIKINLESFNEIQIKLFLSNELGAVTDDAAKSIFKLTQGNPLFIQEMCEKIKENYDLSNIILNSSIIDILIKKGEISKDIENLFIHKFELLNEDAKHLIKTASIIGIAFKLSMLNFIDKEPIDSSIKDVLFDLSKIDVVGEVDLTPEIEYMFTNNLMREVIYRIIPHNEKKELHNRIAEYYLSHYQDNLDSFYEIIATHFIASDNKKMGYKFSLLTAKKAFSESSFNISLYYLGKAVERTEKKDNLQEIKLMKIENLLKLGDFIKVAQLLDDLKEISFVDQKMKDKYFFLQTQSYYNEQKFEDILSFVDDNLKSIRSEFYRNSLKINYFGALRSLNQKAKFAKEVFPFLKELKVKKEEPFINSLNGVIGLFYLDQGMYKKASVYYQNQLKIAEKNNDLYFMRSAMTSLGIIFSRLGDKKSALESYKKALSLAEKMGDKNGASKVLSDLGNLFSQLGDRAKAFDYFDKSYKLSQLVGNRIQEQTSLYSIGREYKFMKEYDKAIEYFLLCNSICKKISYKIGLSFVQDAIGDCYFELGQFEKAKVIYMRNLELQKKLNDREGLGHTYGNLGNIAKDYEKNYPLSIDYYKKQISILEEVGDIDGQGRAYFNWGHTCFESEEFNKSLEKFKLALECFKKCSFDEYIQAAENAINDVKKKIET